MNIISYSEIQVLKSPLNIFLLRLPNFFFRHVNRIKRKLSFDAWSISNRHDADESIKVLFIGKNEIDKNYFCNLIFNENCDDIYLGRVGIWRLLFYYLGCKKNYDLIIVRSRMKLCNLFKSKRNFVVPAWVDCEIDLRGDIGSLSMSKKTLKK